VEAAWLLTNKDGGAICGKNYEKSNQDDRTCLGSPSAVPEKHTATFLLTDKSWDLGERGEKIESILVLE